jgi:hypothetical protein
MMVRFRLGENLDAIVNTADPLNVVAFNLIQEMEARGWVNRLVAGAREARPDNPDVFAVAGQLGLAVRPSPGSPQLERLVRERPFLDIAKIRARLGEIETRVCRVEVPVAGSWSFGTGFLLGPDVVMTNQHVVRPLIDRMAGSDPKSARLRFDYKRAVTGDEVNAGQVFQLADDWLIDHSPPSEVDHQPEPRSGVPDAGELDYALLRAAGGPGRQPVGERAEPGAPPRGWLKIPEEAHAFLADAPLFIVQHPAAGPLQVALDTQAIIKVNANGTRVQYRTNTLPGSSGSPCFDLEWRLVALHHSGDPDAAARAGFNQGIPMAAIVALLKSRGRFDLLG